DEAAAAREEARLDRERVGHVRRGAVHRALDPSHDPTLPVGDDVAGGSAEIDGDGAHGGDAIPAVQGIWQGRRKGFVRDTASGGFVPSPGSPPTIREVNAPERHLRLLTETTAAVNSSLDLEEVLQLVAEKVADALDADACFVYLFDPRAGELVLRATFGTSVDDMTRRPRLRPGAGITGTAA